MSRRAFSMTATGVSVAFLALTFVINPLQGWPWSIPVVTCLIVGAILTYRLPDNRVGWLLLLFGVGGALGTSLQGIASVVDDQVVSGWIDAVGFAINTPAVTYSLGATFLYFPNGKLLTPRWRWAEYVLIGAAITGSLAALMNGGWGGDVSQAIVPSPIRDTFAPVGDILSAGFVFMSGALWFVCAGSAIARFRRSEGELRLQMKWLAFAAGLLIMVALIETAVALTSGEVRAAATGWVALVVAVTFSALPIAVAIAVLRYRLYEIDVVVSRTVVFAVLAGFITATYVLVVVGVGALLGRESDGLFLPIAATALVALAFEPVRIRSQHWANKLVYGSRATPYEVLSELTGRLSAAEDGHDIVLRMAEMLREGTGADQVTVWMGSPENMEPAASSPEVGSASRRPALGSKGAFEVAHNGEVVGALEVIKPKGTALSTAERSLISDLAGSAGAVLGYQRLNDSLAQRAAELEASRQRLVEAQGLERRRLERELHEGAEQYIVALKVKLGVATQLASRHGASDLESILGGLTEEAQAALDDVRSLAKGIYPPILESDGLAAAVSALAASTPVEVNVHRDGVGRYPLDIEAAVYFDISEAVTNAVKHAEAPINIQLGQANGALEFSVVDSGPGFDLDRLEKGSGLENMVDRMSAVGGTLTVRSSVGGRTEVVGSVPLVVDASADFKDSVPSGSTAT